MPEIQLILSASISVPDMWLSELLLDACRSRFARIKAVSRNSSALVDESAARNVSRWFATPDSGDLCDAARAALCTPFTIQVGSISIEVGLVPEAPAAAPGQPDAKKETKGVEESRDTATALQLARLTHRRVQSSSVPAARAPVEGKSATSSTAVDVTSSFVECPFDASHRLPIGMFLEHLEKFHMDDNLGAAPGAFRRTGKSAQQATAAPTSPPTQASEQSTALVGNKRTREESSSGSDSDACSVPRQRQGKEKGGEEDSSGVQSTAYRAAPAVTATIGPVVPASAPAAAVTPAITDVAETRKTVFVGFQVGRTPQMAEQIIRVFENFGVIVWSKFSPQRRCAFIEYSTTAMAIAALTAPAVRVGQYLATVKWSTHEGLAMRERQAAYSSGAHHPRQDLGAEAFPPPPPRPHRELPPAALRAEAHLPDQSESSCQLRKQKTALSDSNPSPLVVIEVDPEKCIPGLFTEDTVFSILAPFGLILDMVVVGNVAQALFDTSQGAAMAVAALSGHEGHKVRFGNLLE
jgi:hypothetical protein